MKITVAIPVGPYPANKRWLPEALASVAAQTLPADEVLLIDDMADLKPADLEPLHVEGSKLRESFAHLGHESLLQGGCHLHLEKPQGEGWWRTYARVWRSPWRLGVGAAFNAGVALARNPLVFMLGSDDIMAPDCLDACASAFLTAHEVDAYYFVDVRYSDGRPDQAVPCNEAMVTQGLWRLTGGFAPESGVGACDAALISTMMVHLPDRLIHVESPEPLVTYRVHADTDTAGRGAYQGPIIEVRNLLTNEWRQPEWAR